MKILKQSIMITIIGCLVVCSHIAFGGMETDSLTVTNSITQTSSGATNSLMGKVGVGTTDPVSALHIDRGIGSYIYGLMFGDGDTGFYEYGDDQFDVRVGGGDRFGFYSGYFRALNVPGPEIGTYCGGTIPMFRGNLDSDTGIRMDNNVIQFINGGSETMRTDSDGNLGIGTNSPSAKLHVAGSARFDSGVTYVPALGDISMGIYTNTP